MFVIRVVQTGGVSYGRGAGGGQIPFLESVGLSFGAMAMGCMCMYICIVYGRIDFEDAVAK